jgi:hypothetical protein
MTDLFTALASQHALLDRHDTSAGGLPERYLYSRDLVHRYAFGRWLLDAGSRDERRVGPAEPGDR